MNKTRMGKRAASLLLSLVMMLSLLPTAAYAAMGNADETQGAIVSENGTGVSDDSNSSGNTDDLQVGDSKDSGNTGDQQVGGSSGSGTADDTTGAEGGADPADSVNGNDSADPQDDGDAVMPVATTVVSTSEELVAAIAAASDGDTITLGEGEFTTYGNTSPKKSLTFEGVGTNTVWTIGDLNQDAKGEGNGDCSFEGCETITFKNMTLKVDNKNYRGFIRINNTVVENCTLEGRTAYWGYETAKFVNATFNAPEGDYALWDYSTKAMTFEGCTFNISGKGVNVYVEAANADEGVTRTVAVNNCTVESTKENKAFLNIKNSTQSYDVTLSGTNTVNGLTANGTTGSALYQVETTEVTETTGKPVTVKQENKAGELETVYEVKKTEKAYVAEVNGVKYDSLQAAIDAASRNATVTMLADTRENVTISTNYLTLDLNGHTLNGGTVAGQPALTVQSRVTVKDSSEEQTGTIMREDTAENSGVSSHYVIDIQDGWLFFESGSVTNNSGVVGVKGASLVRVGDDSVAKYPGLTISGGTFTQDNFIVIKVDRGTFYLKEDGTLNSKNSYAVENWKFAEIKGGTVNGTVAAWTYSGGHNSDLTISGGTVNGNVLSVNYGSAEGKVAKVSITGGTVNGALDTRSYDPSTNELTSIDDATKATIAVTGGTFSSDPTKYVVEDSAINKNDDGTFGVAKAYLAKVGDTSYYTMDEAFKAQTASSEAIVLLRDYTTGSTFNSGSINRTVDLNGHTWTCTGTDANSAAFEINNPNATLTVKNGKVVSSQLVGLIPSAMGGTIKYDNSSLVFDGVEMTTNARSGIETNGNNTNDTVTLRNSTLNVPNGFGIYFPSSGTLTIDNSVINAKTMGVQVCSGSLNISGAGTAITVSGDGIDKTINDGAIEDGAAISIVNRAGYKGLSNIEVKGGTFTAKDGNAAVKAYNWENLTESGFTQNDKVSVSGGTFSSAVDKSLCADGYIPTQNADGTYGVKVGQYVAEVGTTKYETLQAAIAAAQDGQTVRLLADVTLDAQIATGKAITIDGQSKYTIKTVKKLASADGKAGMFYRTQSAKGTLTFLNVTLDGGGVSKIFLNEGGAGETVFDGVTSTNGGGIAYGSGIHISGGGSHATIRNSTLTGSTGTMELNNANYYAANDLWVGGNVYVTVENSVIGNVFVNSAPSATATNGVVHGQLTITGEKTKITYLSGEEEAADKLDKFGNNGSLVKIDSGYVEKVFDKGSYAISGGTFKTEVKKEWCAAGYVPTQNADGTYGVEIGKFTVMVTSRTTGSDSPVANVAGGGSDITYAVGIKVTASAISGYKFVGWFVNEYTGTPYSTDLTCKVKPTDDWTMIAVYEPISGGVFALEVSASKFTVNGGATQRSYLLEKMPVGTQVTVVFKGSENFLYWVNESGKVVSTSKTYTFSMGSATTLKAVYAEKEEHQAMVVFISHTQQVISSKGYTDTQEIQFPEPPIKMGATFVRWSMTEAEIRAAMATTTTGIIVVEPVYEFSAGSYTVTVNYPNDETATYTATVGKITTVTAKSIDGKVFKCWKNGDTVLGYTETLKIAPRGDLTLTAEYVDAGTTVDRLPVIALTEISASQQGAKYAVSFTATRSVPDGYTVTEQGILVNTNSRYGQSDALDAMKLDANGAKPDDTFILKATNTDATGVTVLNGTVSAADRTVYGRAYMILHDSSGAMVYVYSDTILSGSYNSLTTNGGN